MSPAMMKKQRLSSHVPLEPYFVRSLEGPKYGGVAPKMSCRMIDTLRYAAH